MTMPSKICVWDMVNEDGTRDRSYTISFPDGHPNTYIRADLVEELINAGNALLNATSDDDMCDAEDSWLSALRKATGDT